MVRRIFLWVISFMLAASPVLADSQGSATGGTPGTQSTLAGGIYNSSAPTLTNGQQVGLQTDANGQLKVTVSGGGSNACASATGSAVPSAACANGINVGGTLRGQTGSNPTGTTYSAHTDTTSVNGVTTLTGAGATGTGSQRVTAAQDTTTVAGAAPLTTGIYVTGPSAAALATSANQTSVIGTKAPGTAATNSLQTGGVYNSTPPTLTNGQQAATQLTAAGSAKVLDDNSAALLSAAQSPLPAQSSDGVKIGAVQGTVASGSTADTYPVQVGGRAATAAPTAVTDGQIVRQLYTPEGRVVTAPYSIKETMVRGTTTSTDTSAHTIIASAGGSLKNYITNVECGRTDAGATAITLTFNDSASTVVILPSGGATNIQFTIPLATAAATAFQVTSGTGVSTLYCSAQGYTGL